jgi:hypothetical protein
MGPESRFGSVFHDEDFFDATAKQEIVATTGIEGPELDPSQPVTISILRRLSGLRRRTRDSSTSRSTAMKPTGQRMKV